LTHVAKAAGNVIPEHGFSAMLGKEKLSLGENTIVALHIVKDTSDFFGFETSVPLQKIIL